MKKSIQSWKSFDFGPEKTQQKRIIADNDFPDISLKNQNMFPVARSKKKSSFDLFSQLTPKSPSDLAVHPKKIEEVKQWLEKAFLMKNSSQNGIPMLLISGPTGAGKTATLNVLCKNMNIHITEWVNPVDQDFEFVRGPNQMNKFLDFLTSESKYCSLLEYSSGTKIVLVEDFPNMFLKNPSEFADILEECYLRSEHPIVFICTEVTNSNIDLVYSLFPQETLLKFKMSHISFNSCANTLLKNCLRRAHELVQKNKDIFQTPSPKVVEAILSSSMGDIRCAVNQYYFASLLGSNEMPLELNQMKQSGTKRKRSDKTSSIKVMAKDETLGLFHALGRIFNPKRKDHENSWRLNCDIESLIVELESQPEKLIQFLFANYIKYFGDLRELQEASDLLCLSQKFLNKWSESKDLHPYPLWLSILGLMIINNHKVSRWNQIEGPKKIKKNILRNQGTVHPTDQFYIDIIERKVQY